VNVRGGRDENLEFFHDQGGLTLGRKVFLGENSGTSMIGKSQGETEIPLDSAG
jgi:hypothetical protein